MDLNSRARDQIAFDTSHRERERETVRKKEIGRRDRMTVGEKGVLKRGRESRREGERKREIRSGVRCTRSRSLHFIDADI